MAQSKAVILCVDDEEIPRRLRALTLETQGYEVIAVASAREALEMLARRRFDLLLTDQIMPGMQGTELTKRVKSATPEMPVVIISGVNEIPVDAVFADRFISKVEGPEALFRGVAAVLERYRGGGCGKADSLAGMTERKAKAERNAEVLRSAQDDDSPCDRPWRAGLKT